MSNGSIQLFQYASNLRFGSHVRKNEAPHLNNRRKSAITTFASMLALNRNRRQRWRVHHEKFLKETKGILDSDYFMEKSGIQDFQSSTHVKADYPDSYTITCKFCGRSFNETVYEKHIPRCDPSRQWKLQLSAPDPEKLHAIQRYRARMKFRPVFLSNSHKNEHSLGLVFADSVRSTSSSPSPTSSVTLNLDRDDSSRSVSPISGMEENSSWNNVVLQSSNCNQLRSAAASAHGLKLKDTHKPSDPVMKHADLGKEDSQTQSVPPLDSTIRSVNWSPTSIPSSLSTLSFTRASDFVREKPRPVSPYTAPNTDFHCPWSPTVSSFTDYGATNNCTYTIPDDPSIHAATRTDSFTRNYEIVTPLSAGVTSNTVKQLETSPGLRKLFPLLPNSVNIIREPFRDNQPYQGSPRNEVLENFHPQSNTLTESASNMIDVHCDKEYAVSANVWKIERDNELMQDSFSEPPSPAFSDSGDCVESGHAGNMELVDRKRSNQYNFDHVNQYATEQQFFPQNENIKHSNPALRSYAPGMPTALVLTKASLSCFKSTNQNRTTSHAPVAISPEEEEFSYGGISVPTLHRDSMYCHQCGCHYVTAKANFCSVCGTAKIRLGERHFH